METDDVIQFLKEKRELLGGLVDHLDQPHQLDHALKIAARMDRLTSVIADLKHPGDELE